MGKVKEIQVIELNGTPRERGRIHGETLRSQIHNMVADWKENIHADTGIHPDLFFKKFLEQTNYLPAAQRWTPDLLEEVKGIAEGSGVPFDIIFARQLSDEEPMFRLEVKFGNYWGIEHCSALGVGRQGAMHPIIAQNMDMPSYCDGYQILAHIQQPGSDIEALVLTIAGKISLAGLNNRGVGICCNSLLQLDFARDGLAEDFVVRGTLQQTDLDHAVGFMRAVHHASGQNYVLGDPQHIVDLEVSTHRIDEYHPLANAERVYHTNHPIVNDDQEIWNRRMDRSPKEQTQAYLARSTSRARLGTLARYLADPNEIITVEKIKTILSSHEGPVCIDGGDDKISLACLIMELSPNPTLHLSPGPPCSTPFKTYRFGE